MKLVPISDNCLINPSKIGACEQVIERGKVVLYIWVDGQRFEYQMDEVCPIKDFLDIVSEALPVNHTWVG